MSLGLRAALHKSRRCLHTAAVSSSVLMRRRLRSFHSSRTLLTAKGPDDDHNDVIVPGAAQYGSLGDHVVRRRIARAPAPWQAADNSHVQDVTVKAMIYELNHEIMTTMETTVPWFLENMPPQYFRQVPERFRMDHIKAVATVKGADMDLHLNLQGQLPDGRSVLTYIRPSTKPGTLLKMIEEDLTPWKYETAKPLSRLHVFSALDGSMSLNMFVYGHRKKKVDLDVETLGSRILEHAAAIQAGELPENLESDSMLLQPNPLFERDALVQYMKDCCTETYIRVGSDEPKRFLQQRMLVNQVSGTEGTAVHVSEASVQPQHFHHDDTAAAPGHPYYWVDLAVANSLPQVALGNLCRLLYVHGFDVSRARLDVVPDGDNGSITVLRTLVQPVQPTVHPETWRLLELELKRSKWLDPATTMDLVFNKYPDLGVKRGEIITALCALMHPVLAKENPIAFSNANIYDTVSRRRFIEPAKTVADLFLDRFNPVHPLPDDAFEERCQEIYAAIDSDVEDTVAAEILLKMVDIVRHTLKTNVYMSNRYALGFRLNPAVMVAAGEEQRELPYGVLFVHGRRFTGYHVRFRDIARGGMRLVTPGSAEQFALESMRQYDECYGLAFAQQLKNKDIPEGGSKAVNLINTSGLSEAGKGFVKRKSVKAFTDTILDLIVDTPETREKIVDLFGKREVLYLGPDEQVLPEDIEWIVKRAAKRGYGTPAAFMSSKPRSGINHKEYGVTSEGVHVYLDVALRHVLGIDPTKDAFTIKMTGGPDGDVGGNAIKILIREYGDNVKIVGIADHSGSAEDPAGLDHNELLRLFHAGLSIASFDKSKLGSDGVLHTCETPEGVKARNSMHNRLEADAFMPCGGRPNTIDITNWRHFLKSDGTPSAPLIVEGANLFVTAEARQALFEDAGVVIVKDSSANKGGVITSSYEICAAMLLSDEEFFANKEQIVDEVLDKLRGRAKMEAELLFREFENFGGSLPDASQVISNCINIATDALATALDSLSEDDRDALLPLFRSHLPNTMADLAFDRVDEKVPDQYIKNAISSCLASHLVYKEGTKFIAAQPPERLAAIALTYLTKEKEVAVLMESLAATDMPAEQKKEALRLLEAGGARTALGVY